MYSAEASVLIPAEVGTVWTYVSSYPNFPQFIGHIERIVMLGDATSEWKLSGSAATPMILKVVTTESSPARRLSWQSLEGNIETQGSFSLEPEGNDTRLTLQMKYQEPRGPLAKTFAILFQNLEQMLAEDLQRLTALVVWDQAEQNDQETSETAQSSSSTANPLESEIVQR